MKNKLAEILCVILNKMNVSIIMGCEIKGEITVTNNDQFFYSNSLSDAKLFYDDGEEFTLPEGKFTIKSCKNNEGKWEAFYTKIVKKISK